MKDYTNYLSVLNLMKDSDSIISILRKNNAVYHGKNFFIVLLFKPLTNLSGLFNNGASITSKLMTISPYIGLLFGGFVSLNYQTYFGYIGMIISYIVSVTFFLSRMVILDDQHFHIEAYKLFKKREFEFITTFLTNPEFTFKGLYDYVNRVLTTTDQGHAEVARLSEQIDKLTHMREKHITELEMELRERDEAIQKYDQVLEEFEIEHQLEIRNLSLLLDKSIRSLLRLRSNRLINQDLSIISPFSLYKLSENKLLLQTELSTNSPLEIVIDDPKNYLHSCVVAATHPEDYPIISNPRSGRIVVSKRLNMGNNEIWVYNFHFSEHDTDFINLCKDVTIEAEELYRLIHGLCFHLQLSGQLKEVV